VAVTKGQRVIVALLVLANILVIGGMATYVISQSRGSAAEEPLPAPVQDSTLDSMPIALPCAEYLIESLMEIGETVRVSILDRAIVIEVSFHQQAPASPERPEVSPQVLWTLLDSLSPTFTRICGTPEWVTLSARFEGPGLPEVFTAELAGERLESWLEGTLDDTGLASEANYRAPYAGAGRMVPAPAP
jgi:hypothetical protein